MFFIHSIFFYLSNSNKTKQNQQPLPMGVVDRVLMKRGTAEIVSLAADKVTKSQKVCLSVCSFVWLLFFFFFFFGLFSLFFVFLFFFLCLLSSFYNFDSLFNGVLNRHRSSCCCLMTCLFTASLHATFEQVCLFVFVIVFIQ